MRNSDRDYQTGPSLEQALRENEYRKQPRVFKWLTALVAVAIVFVLLVIGGALYPFEPYKFSGYTDVPSETCQGQPINNGYVVEVEGGPFIVGHVEGDAYLLDERGKPLESYAVDSDLPNDMEKQEVSSYVQRVAPLFEGEFKLGAKFVVNGWVLGFIPTYQEETVRSEQTITVLGDNDPRCD